MTFCKTINILASSCIATLTNPLAASVETKSDSLFLQKSENNAKSANFLKFYKKCSFSQFFFAKTSTKSAEKFSFQQQFSFKRKFAVSRKFLQNFSRKLSSFS
jgi:hypothetical protein